MKWIDSHKSTRMARSIRLRPHKQTAIHQSRTPSHLLSIPPTQQVEFVSYLASISQFTGFLCSQWIIFSSFPCLYLAEEPISSAVKNHGKPTMQTMTMNPRNSKYGMSSTQTDASSTAKQQSTQSNTSYASSTMAGTNSSNANNQ